MSDGPPDPDDVDPDEIDRLRAERAWLLWQNQQLQMAIDGYNWMLATLYPLRILT